MSDDSDPISEKVQVSSSSSGKTSDLGSLFGELFDYKTLKTSVFIFILFFIICSDSFKKLLNKFSDTTDGYGEMTNFGIALQGLVLSIAYILFSVLIKTEII